MATSKGKTFNKIKSVVSKKGVVKKSNFKTKSKKDLGLKELFQKTKNTTKNLVEIQKRKQANEDKCSKNPVGKFKFKIELGFDDKGIPIYSEYNLPELFISNISIATIVGTLKLIINTIIDGTIEGYSGSQENKIKLEYKILSMVSTYIIKEQLKFMPDDIRDKLTKILD